MVFTDYHELTSHIHDVIHFARPMFENSSHSFSVATGEIDVDKMLFVNDCGENIPLKYEAEYELYYSAFSVGDYEVETIMVGSL